jgi:CRISPR/Cas system CMR subunit Cmr6 (Cas7 group RAMP superfamily)
MEVEKKNFVKIDLVGINEKLFGNLRGKLITMIENVLESSIDKETGLTLKEEIDKFTSLGINYAESKLKKASFENDKLVSEIKEKYSQIERNKAESRKINAEARAIEFNQKLKELTFTLKMTKTLLIGQKGDEAIAFTKQLDSFLDVIESVRETNRIE